MDLYQVLIILQMSKYILSESLIDQQYRTLHNFFKMSDHFWKHCPKVLEAQYINFIVEVDPLSRWIHTDFGVTLYTLTHNTPYHAHHFSSVLFFYQA